ncbi:hypothetical protein ABT297_31680 [Dactylosporangium sp. NPDC000555]|uniref:hypothetical protein n=1 Tax=Dactylosporangium sp. NPDC000555 TaxID=3154260 RepID=UPI003325506B
MLLAGCLTLAGCAASDRSPAESETAFNARALQVADLWQAALTGASGTWRAGFVPLQELTIPPGGLTDELRVASAAGWFRTNVALPARVPPAGLIAYPDGTTASVPLIGAQAAYERLAKGEPPCEPPAAPAPTNPANSSDPSGSVGVPAPHTCAQLTVTGAELGSTTIRTSRGAATVPAWLFTVAELPSPVARVAVADTEISPVPHPSVPPMDAELLVGLASASRLTGTQDLELTYTVDIGACEDAPSGLVYQTPDVVVVAALRGARTSRECVALLKRQPVTVRLDAPLGAAVVVDAVFGAPLQGGVSS